MPVELIRDRDSFQAKLEEAIAARKRIRNTPIAAVDGAEETLNAAKRELDHISEFVGRIEDHIRNSSFKSLPLMRDRSGRPLPRHYRLECGPFMGVFLIGEDDTKVVALVFSTQPHSFRERLQELADRHKDTLAGKRKE